MYVHVYVYMYICIYVRMYVGKYFKHLYNAFHMAKLSFNDVQIFTQEVMRCRWDYEDGYLHDGNSVLIRGRQTRVHSLSTVWGPREKAAICMLGREPMSETESFGSLITDFPSFRTVRNKCILLKPPSLWCIFFFYSNLSRLRQWMLLSQGPSTNPYLVCMLVQFGLIFLGYHNKVQDWLDWTREIYFLIILDARSSRSRFQSIWLQFFFCVLVSSLCDSLILSCISGWF